jgi:hypothetical protein
MAKTLTVSLPAFVARRSAPLFASTSPSWLARGSAVAFAAVAPSPPVEYVPTYETVPSLARW